MRKLLIGAIALSSIAVSCQKEQKTETKEVTTQKECGYSIDTLDSTIEWTAFKTTDKVAVGGQFTSFKFEKANSNATSLESLFTGLKFNIDVNSTNTKNAVRDKKIVDTFFGTFTKKQPITGTVKTFNDGKALIDIKMGSTVKEVAFDYLTNGDDITFTSTINVNDWQGNIAIKALNDICYDLHKGPDGVSKLWSEVDLKIKADVNNKECE